MAFSLFHKKYRLLDSNLLAGAIDCHSHILPGLDDGVPSMDYALNVLAYYEQIGISEVWFTPHIFEDIPNTPLELRQHYDELLHEYSGNIKLHLGAENMVDGLFLERLEADDVLPVGSHGDHLLIEFSFMQPPMHIYDIIKNIQDKGFTPILAHPERYPYLTIEEYQKLKDRGCKLQMNITSLVGEYGKHTQKKAQTLLLEGLYDICGTDLHSLSSFKHAVQQKKLDKDIMEKLHSLMHQTF